jgi:hypothetical protein
LQIASNPCVAYVQHIVLPWFNKFDVERTEANGGNKCACVAYSLLNLCLRLPWVNSSRRAAGEQGLSGRLCGDVIKGFCPQPSGNASFAAFLLTHYSCVVFVFPISLPVPPSL